MSKGEEIKNKIRSIEAKISKLNQEVDYYNSLQLALKLVLNGSVFPPIVR